MNSSSFHLGLIGYPLGHSLSPKIHAAALKACGLRGDYSLFPIHPDDKQGLKDLLNRVRSGEITGLNVTIPHKQNVIPLLDELTPTAQAIGAVNTIYRHGEKLIGENTDAAGFLSDLKKNIGNWKLGIGKLALVLGAGGAARAVIYALLHDGWQVTLAARRIEQAGQLANSFTNYKLQVTSYETFQPSNLPTFNLLINTTPVGMSPNIEASPLPENIVLNKNTVVYDLVYNPRETKLVKDARANGLQATTGLGMLIEQAALAFEIWTGCNPPRYFLFESVGATRSD
ncbi:shikimate dehydrogenase [bacterium]|nr:shikimate dehydrogenase [bacterium]NCT19524.1 shikimate dehydrogenase [bacterium]OIO85886.1 MAG: shikimate dehydrogenase [Anaerolineae bacterium CG2_30_57_67]